MDQIKKFFKKVGIWFTKAWKAIVRFFTPIFTKKYTVRDILTGLWVVAFFVIAALIIFL
jgi:hypothetical protein